jgi:2'-5' RNA ligase
MREPFFYRYFFAFRPNLIQRCWLESIATAAGQSARRIQAEYFHLTLFVIAELAHRDDFVTSRATSALARQALFSCPFWLGRLRGGRNGARLEAVGRQGEIQAFYRMLVALVAARGLVPLHRKSGLNPHVTLGYDPCTVVPMQLPFEWIPDELLLIESEVGKGIHNVLARWPLLAPRQGFLPFESAPLPCVAGGAALR